MIDYDKYGHCVLCHTNMRVEQVIGGKVQMRFTPDYDETEYLLDDGTRMRVAVCKPCKATLGEHHEKKIMDAVIKGWDMEMKEYKWKPEKREAYMGVYSHRAIVCKSEEVPKDLLDKRYGEYLKKRNEGKDGSHIKDIHL